MKKNVAIVTLLLTLLIFTESGSFAKETPDLNYEEYLASLSELDNPVRLSEDNDFADVRSPGLEGIETTLKNVQAVRDARSEDEIHYIATAKDFMNFCDYVNDVDSSAHGELIANIDLSDYSYGYFEGGCNFFTGTFFGNGYTITVNVTGSFSEPCGLFAVAAGAVIDGVRVEGSADGDIGVGALVGLAFDSVITNCSNHAEINGYYGRSGGIVGYAVDSSLISCYNTGDVYTAFDWRDTAFVGGITGVAEGNTIVYACYNMGEVKGVVAAGIVASNSGIIANCYNAGTVADFFFDGSALVNFNSPKSYLGNCVYLADKAVTDIYGQYGTAENNLVVTATELQSTQIVAGLNTNPKVTVPFYKEDSNHLNAGCPVLNWQEAPLSTYNIHFNGDGEASKTKAQVGETVVLEAPWVFDKIIHWTVTPVIDFTIGDNNTFRAGFIMPAEDVTIQGVYVDDPAPFRFMDVPTKHWAAPYIYELHYQGIIHGKTATLFDPEANITRAEMVKILAMAVGVDVEYYEGWTWFTDVPENAWFAPYVSWAADYEIIYGYDGYFYPNDPIDRQELAAILYRYYDYFANAPLPEIEEYKQFKDQQQIEWWAEESIYSMQMAGVLKGYSDGTFRPYDNATRVEAAKVVSVLLQLLY